MFRLPDSIKKVSNDGNGFSLIEIIVGMFILSMALMGMAILTGAVIQGNSHGDKLTEASILAQDKIEYFKHIDYDSIVSSSTNEQIERMTRYWVVTDDSPGPDMKNLKVTVEWLNLRDQSQRITISTIISKQQ